LVNIKDYIGAITDFTKAIEIDPVNAKAYVNRGSVKSFMLDHKGAIIDFNSAIQINPNEPMPFFNRGCAKGILKDYKGAISDYTKAIEMNPSWVANLYFNRGLAQIELGQKESGCLDLYKAGELGNKTALVAVIKYCK